MKGLRARRVALRCVQVPELGGVDDEADVDDHPLARLASNDSVDAGWEVDVPIGSPLRLAGWPLRQALWNVDVEATAVVCAMGDGAVVERPASRLACSRPDGLRSVRRGVERSTAFEQGRRECRFAGEVEVGVAREDVADVVALLRLLAARCLQRVAARGFRLADDLGVVEEVAAGGAAGAPKSPSRVVIST